MAETSSPNVATSTSARPPLIIWVASSAATRSRLVALLVLVSSLSLLGIAASISPDPAGLGSHQQLDLAPCTIPLTTGFPCPTCGMTTAFAYWTRASPVASFHAHPGGLALAAATTGTVVASLAVLTTGRVWRVAWYRVSPYGLPLALAVLVIGGWVYKLAVGLLSGTLPLAR